jgi:hypothetical protein
VSFRIDSIRTINILSKGITMKKRILSILALVVLVAGFAHAAPPFSVKPGGGNVVNKPCGSNGC